MGSMAAGCCSRKLCSATRGDVDCHVAITAGSKLASLASARLTSVNLWGAWPHADGQQWAVGKAGGLAAIPESHRQEVQELLTAQFEFFAAVSLQECNGQPRTPSL